MILSCTKVCQSTEKQHLSDNSQSGDETNSRPVSPTERSPLPYEEFGERKVILKLQVLLYNYQTSTIGINPILNLFMSRTEGFYSYKIKEFKETAINAFTLT